MPDRDYEPCREQRNSEHERRRDWRLALVFIGLCALLVAYLASGCGATQAPVVLGRWQRAMALYDCAEKVLPPDSLKVGEATQKGTGGVASASDSAGSLVTCSPTLSDAGAADSSMPRGIDTVGPWWEPDGGVK